MLPFSLFLSLKYLKPKRSFLSVVTLISVVGVLLGVAILVIVTSVMTGFDNMWREKILSFKPHLTVVSDYGVLRDEEALCQRIEAVEGVTAVAPVIETLVLMQNRGRTAAPVVLGIDADRAARMSQIPAHVREGTFDLEGGQAVVGVDLAYQLGLRPGSRALMYSEKSVVSPDELHVPEEVGISGVFDMQMRDFDAGFVLTSLDVARELVGLEEGAYAIYVMTEDPFRFDEYARRVALALDDKGVTVRTWKEVDSLLFSALSHEKATMFALLMFITIVAIFCVANTLIVITVQKTHEIGLLKALGFSSVRIMAVFVWHGWVQCLVGTLAGIGTGLLVLTNLSHIIAGLARLNVRVFPKEIYGLSEMPWATSLEELARIAATVMVFCTLASIIPAWRAARMSPAEALRHE